MEEHTALRLSSDRERVFLCYTQQPFVRMCQFYGVVPLNGHVFTQHPFVLMFAQPRSTLLQF